MSQKFIILGAGRQGVAAAYDIARFAEGASILLADANESTAQRGSDRINKLLGGPRVQSVIVDVSDRRAVTNLLRGATVALSAVPYRLNYEITCAAIDAKCHICDLGGNTDVVFQQLDKDKEARSAGIAIVPDCGLQPGMGNTLAVHLMQQMSHPEEVSIWVGGIPKEPAPPFNYILSFNIEGLTNEYDEDAVVLRGGERVSVAPFSDIEPIEVPGVGRCEAFITTGGASTCPWSFEDALQLYEEKTIRYPGHGAAFKAFRDLGLFSRSAISVGSNRVIPREMYHELLSKKIKQEEKPDLIYIKVSCKGSNKGKDLTACIEMTDSYDINTGFRAMERTTGWSVSIVAQMLANGEINPGAVPLEKSVPPDLFLKEAKRRGFIFNEWVE